MEVRRNSSYIPKQVGYRSWLDAVKQVGLAPRAGLCEYNEPSRIEAGIGEIGMCRHGRRHKCVPEMD